MRKPASRNNYQKGRWRDLRQLLKGSGDRREVPQCRYFLFHPCWSFCGTDAFVYINTNTVIYVQARRLKPISPFASPFVKRNLK